MFVTTELDQLCQPYFMSYTCFFYVNCVAACISEKNVFDLEVISVNVVMLALFLLHIACINSKLSKRGWSEHKLLYMV